MAETVVAPLPRGSAAGDTQAPNRGAIAPGGGWFTDTMLSALTRYQEHQRIADLVAVEQTP
jgi:hypothetical protein